MALIKLFRPIEKFIIRKIKIAYLFKWMHPNIISIISLIFGIISCYFFYNNKLLNGAISLFVSIIFDLIDGEVARLKNKETSFGKYLDPIIDKTVEFLVYFGLSKIYPIEAFLAMGASFLIGDAKSWAFINKKLDNFDWPSIGDKADRYSLLFLGIIVSAISKNILYLRYALIGIAIIGFIGFLLRIRFAKKLLKIDS